MCFLFFESDLEISHFLKLIAGLRTASNDTSREQWELRMRLKAGKSHLGVQLHTYVPISIGNVCLHIGDSHKYLSEKCASHPSLECESPCELTVVVDT